MEAVENDESDTSMMNITEPLQMDAMLQNSANSHGDDDDDDDELTGYERLMEAPSNEQLTRYWIAWSVFGFLVAALTLILCLSILTSRKARRKSHYLYLVYLTIPDFLLSFFCAITCLLNSIQGEYWETNNNNSSSSSSMNDWMCTFQQWYFVFGIGSNFWLNALITREIHKMLQRSKSGQRYISPTHYQITKQAGIVYLCCAMLGSFGILSHYVENFPFQIGTVGGLVCLPIGISKDKSIRIFFWSFFFPFFVGIPLLYITYVSVDIWYWSHLLPPFDKRRSVTIYFFRLILVFCIIWLPCLAILFVFAPWLPTWAQFAGGIWCLLQGAVSAIMSMLKPEIRRSVQLFLTCNCGSEKDNFFRNNAESGSGGGRGPRRQWSSVRHGNSSGDGTRTRPSLREANGSIHFSTSIRDIEANASAYLSTSSRHMCKGENENDGHSHTSSRRLSLSSWKSSAEIPLGSTHSTGPSRTSRREAPKRNSRGNSSVESIEMGRGSNHSSCDEGEKEQVEQNEVPQNLNFEEDLDYDSDFDDTDWSIDVIDEGVMPLASIEDQSKTKSRLTPRRRSVSSTEVWVSNSEHSTPLDDVMECDEEYDFSDSENSFAT